MFTFTFLLNELDTILKGKIIGLLSLRPLTCTQSTWEMFLAVCHDLQIVLYPLCEYETVCCCLRLHHVNKMG